MIRLDGEQYWLYAAVDPDSNDLLHTKREPTRTNVLAHAFVRDLRETHAVDDAVFLVDGATPHFRSRAAATASRAATNNTATATASNVSSAR